MLLKVCMFYKRGLEWPMFGALVTSLNSFSIQKRPYGSSGHIHEHNRVTD